MQWLANICVRRPVFASVLVLTLSVVGAFSFQLLGLDRFPKVDFPTILVTARQPGASPEQIESEVTDKLEEALNTISGIDDLRSTSSEGISQVIVSFVLQKNIDVAAQEVRDKINGILPQLPTTTEQPTVEKVDPDAAPVLTVAVSASQSVRDITEYADKVLRRRLESVSGVGQVLVLGGRERQINIWLDGNRLQAYNLTVTDVSRALQRQNAEIPGGRIEEGPRTLTLRTLGRVPSVEVFNDIVVRQQEGHPVLLRDVARVEDGMADATSLANVNGASTVVLQIRRQSGTNTVQVVEAVKERIEDIRPTLPKGYDIRVVRDMSEFIKASIDAVEEHLVLGSILAAAVVFFFLWNVRSTIIAAIAIPTSIISTFGLMWYMGFTLNVMTMLGLTLAVGIVIDDAIVVLENIYRFIEEKGMSPFEAAIEGTKEIGLAVLATTLSLVAIFVPVGFMGGIVGRFMQSFGLTMAFAIMVSLFVSFTLTPMMSARWLKAARPDNDGRDVDPDAGPVTQRSKDSRVFGAMDRGYTWLMRWSLAHRWVVAAVTVLVFLSTIPLFVIVNKSFLPNDDQSEFEIILRAPEGTSLESTELVASRISARVRELAPETAYTLVTAGANTAQTPNTATIYVRLKAIKERARDQFAVMGEVRERLMKEYDNQGLRIAVQPIATIGGGGNQNADLQFLINGPDLDKLAKMGTTLAADVRKLPGLVDVDTSLNVGKPELSVTVDRLKSADLGVEIADAAEALRLLVGGDEVTNYNEGGEQYEVHLRAEEGNRVSKTAIGNLTVPSSRLGSVSLENVAAITDGESPSEVMRLNRQRQVTVFANTLPGASQSEAIALVQQKFAEMNSDPAYRGAFVGRSRELGRAAQNFLIAFALSLIFMYLILAAQFESWLHPVTILLSLPLTLPFALLSLIITGQSLNIFSALGLLVLFGVVKKNSILQIDHAIQLRERGLDKDAAIVQASRDRLRPILMTTIAFVAGMIPLVWSSGIGAGTNRAIGFVIIGGQTLALLLTLVATPVAYSLFDSASNFRLFGRLRALVPFRRAAATSAGALLLWTLLGSEVQAQILAAPQTPSASVPPAVAQATAPQPGARQLTLAEAVEQALSNNPDLAVARVEPELGITRTQQAWSAFLPFASGTSGRTSTTTPSSNPLQNAEGTLSNTWFASAGVRERLPWGGGTWNVAWDNTRTTSNSFLNNFNPNLSAGLMVAFSQPLLRDFTMDAAKQQLIITKRNQTISDLRFKEAVVQTMAAVKQAYWNLVSANANVQVQQQSLDLAMELVRMNKARVDVGQSPPLDLVSAQAEAAQRRDSLIVATFAARAAEDALRTLIMKPGDTAYWSTRLQPSDTPPVGGPPPNVDAAAQAALADRSDLGRARVENENARTNVTYYRNQRLPDLRLEASHRAAGLAGTRLLREGGFPGMVVGQEEIGFGTAGDQIWGRDYPTWTVGVSVSYAIGRSYEDAGLVRARLEERQAKSRLESLEIQTVREIRQAAWDVESTGQRIEATRASRELAEQRLDAEQKRYGVGMSTSFLVVQAQRDLAQARTTELTAVLDHQIAQVNFEALQRAPGTGTVVLNNGNITPLPPPTPRGIQPANGSTTLF